MIVATSGVTCVVDVAKNGITVTLNVRKEGGRNPIQKTAALLLLQVVADYLLFNIKTGLYPCSI